MKKFNYILLSIAFVVVIFTELFLFVSHKKTDVKAISYQHTDSSFAEDVGKIEYTNSSQRKGLTTFYLEIDKSNINEVKKYSKVQYLTIDGTDIKTMPDLTGLQAHSVDLKNVINFDMNQLDVSRISSLTLDKAYLTDVTIIGKMKNIKSITINEGKMDSIDFLSSLSKLTSIAIWSSNVKDYSAVGDLKRLDSLTISNCKLNDISFLENCSSITRLDLHNNVISDISPVKALSKLRSANLSKNKIRGAVDLSTLEELKNVDLSFNEISDVSIPISELYSADLSYNKLKTINDKMLNEFKTLTDNSSLQFFNVFGNILENHNQLKKFDFISYYNEKNVDFSYEDFEKYINEIKNITDKYIDGNWNDLQKAIAVYNYFVSNIKFYYEYSDNESYPVGIWHTEYGALVNKKAVCYGFSYAYRDILKYLNIECMIYHGDINSTSDNETHAWNIIKIDGEYYHCDLTWKNFGLSDNTMLSKKYFLLDKTAPKCSKDMNQDIVSEILVEAKSYANNEVTKNE